MSATVKTEWCFTRKWLPQLQSSEDQNILPEPQCLLWEVTSFLNYHISTGGEKGTPIVPGPQMLSIGSY